MLSKQQKLKYGQLLRQQMKEKQQRKKFESKQKRGGGVGHQIQNMQVIQPPIRQPVGYNNPQILQKENTYQQQQKQYIDPKEELQRKLESQSYNYFGAPGGGAPNRKGQQQQYAQYNQPNQYGNNNMSQPSGLKMPVQDMYNQQQNMQYNQLAGQRVRTMSQQPSYYPPQMNDYNNLAQQSISPQSGYNRQQQPEHYQNPMMGGRVSSNPYLQPTTQQNYPPSNYAANNYREQSRQPISYEYIADKPSRVQQQQYQYQPPSPYQMGGRKLYQQAQLQPNNGLVREQLQQQNYPGGEQPQQSYERENQQLQQVYRKGGRNLLKLENQTIDEHLIKQKRKMEIQKQLKQQIQEAQKKKKDEKQRIKRQEEEQEIKHVAYLTEQKRKIDEEEKKKRDQKQKMIDDNVRNLQRKKQFEQQAKQKAQQEQKDRTDKQKRQRQAQLNKEQQQKLAEQKKNQSPQQQQFSSNQNSYRNNKPSQRITQDDTSSVVSSDTSELQKGFNTALSKQFFRKQRERNNPSFSQHQNQKLQKVTTQIHKMSHEINQQREMFDREIQRVKDGAQRAQIQKKKAEDENQQLKKQLKRKMDDDNEKLLRALKGNDSRNDFTRLPQQHYGRNLNEYQARERQQQDDYPSFNKKKPLRQKQSQNLVRRDYQPQQQPMKYQPRKEDMNQFEQSNVGLVSLDGESKKIPLFLQHGDNLTMSQVQNFAKDSAFFQKGGLGFKSSPKNNQNSHNRIQQPYNRIQQSIVEQVQEQRDYLNSNSRKQNRGLKKQSSLYKNQRDDNRNQKDELDKMLQSRAKSRGWGEMSSVNSDITKQIQQLLKKKDNLPVIQGGGINRNGRPNSISNAAKQSLNGNNGYAYDGLTLNSNVGNNGIGTIGSNGTLDIDRINGRNDARLRQLRNLGVETVNTNGDEELDQLDQLLNKYK